MSSNPGRASREPQATHAPMTTPGDRDEPGGSVVEPSTKVLLVLFGIVMLATLAGVVYGVASY